MQFQVLKIIGLIGLILTGSTFHAQSISGVVNQYVAVSSVNTNSVNVTSSQGFSVGDRVLLIQMKGATISSANNVSFGQIQNYGDAGNFEFTNIAAINGTTITFVQNLCKTFTVSGLVQLIRVPVYNQVTIVGALTALPWNGAIGGVVAIEATGGITFNANIDVQGQGFVGGTWTNGFFACGDANYANSGNTAGKKGEGIVAAPLNMDGNRAPLANGGGGSNSGNPGAGGGGNGGAGGRGGNEFLGWCAVNGSFGLGGYPLNYSNYRAFLGGGGGGGYRDNGLTVTNGSRGGGIVFLTAPTVQGNNAQIVASAANVIGNTDSEGAGGGGAGGCVYLLTQNVTSPLSVDVRGGNGGNILSTLWSSACHGPGGGGGGGAIIFQQGALPANVNFLLSGGQSGSVLHSGPACAGTPHGAQPGANGILQPNYVPPGPLGGVNLGPDTLMCLGSAVTLQPDTVYASYSWSNGSTGPSLSVSVPGTYWLDVPSGCGTARDSIVVSIVPDTFDLGPDVSHCWGDSSLVIAPMNYQSYAWSNGNIGLQDWIQNGGIYAVSVVDGYGCTNTDSITVNVLLPDTTLLSAQICSDSSLLFNGQSLSTSGMYSMVLQNHQGCDSLVTLTLQVNPIPVITAIDTTICSGECVSLYAYGAQNYVWQDAALFTAQNTVCPNNTDAYSVQGVNAFGCFSVPVNAQVNVVALIPPNFSLSPLQLELSDPTVTIFNNVNPNQSYQWVINGESFVNNSPEFSWDLPMVEGVYVIELTVSNILGCSQTISRTVEITNTVSLYIPNSFTPDGEEENATFYPVFSPGFTPENYWFAIYNRWGEIVFESYDVANGWDGYLPYGIKCPVGVYTYVLRYGGQEDGQWEQFYGFVNLIR
jgi:hypothetical protein